MAKNIYIGVGNVARKVTQPYFGVGSVARKVKAGYIGVGGVARQFFPGGITVSSLPVGTIVKLKVGGVSTDFIIVHQGLPSNMYDSSCNGTWLMTKGALDRRAWHSTIENTYSISNIHQYLNGDFLNSLDTGVASKIKQAKIPHAYGYYGSSDGTIAAGSVRSGANGLSSKIFLPSLYEVRPQRDSDNMDDSWLYSIAPKDGDVLSYFNNADDSRLIVSGVVYWWTRSVDCSQNSSVVTIYDDGTPDTGQCNSTYYLRPTLILQPDTVVDANYNVIA